jgi:hypothetical protein
VIGLVLAVAFAVFIAYLGSPSQTGCSVQQEERSVSSAVQCGWHAHPAHPNVLDTRWFSWLVVAVIVAYVLFRLRSRNGNGSSGTQGTLRRLLGRR